MLSMLLFWDANGDVVGTIDYMVQLDENGTPLGLIDFANHEAAGGRLRDVADLPSAVGAGAWPEWIGGLGHHFRVELDPSPGQARARIKALVHKKSGHRRERAVVEGEIERRVTASNDKARKEGDEVRKKAKALGLPPDGIPDPDPEPVDLRSLLGGPDWPLQLDDQGRTRPRVVSAQRPNLPVVAVGKGSGQPSQR